MDTLLRLHRAARGLLTCAHCWLLTLGSLITIGVGLALLLTTSPQNLAYNLSSLGVDERVAPLFNGAFMATGLGLLILAFMTRRSLLELQRRGRRNGLGALVQIGGLIMLGLSLTAIGLFRIDQPVLATIHGLASRMAILSGALLMLGAPAFLGLLFQWGSRLLTGAMGGMFALSGVHRLSYTVIEVAVLILVGIWLYWFQTRLRSMAHI